MSSSGDSDRSTVIVERIQSGVLPKTNFKTLIQIHQEQLYWQIRRCLKNHEDTQDVLQNVFIKIWKGLDSFKLESNFSTWAYRIAYNESMTFLNKGNKLKAVDEPTVYLATLEASNSNLSAPEIEKILFNAIELLPDKQRLVFELKYFDNKKFSEISEITGTSVGALKTSYHLAKKKIEEFVNMY